MFEELPRMCHGLLRLLKLEFASHFEKEVQASLGRRVRYLE